MTIDTDAVRRNRRRPEVWLWFLPIIDGVVAMAATLTTYARPDIG